MSVKRASWVGETSSKRMSYNHILHRRGASQFLSPGHEGLLTDMLFDVLIVRVNDSRPEETGFFRAGRSLRAKDDEPSETFSPYEVLFLRMLPSEEVLLPERPYNSAHCIF